MNITGLVTEYNPFHNGHLYHLENAKNKTKADAIVVVMSGNFVQRGTPALLDKWTRTEMALKCGADLVIELPSTYATGSAEIFALGAIRVLNGLGKVNHVIFGSESGQIEPLQRIAEYVSKETPEFQEALKLEMGKGFSFPVARENALKQILDNNNIPTLPNDILGIEYLKAGIRTHSKMKFDTIKRISSDYHDLDTEKALSSATAIRKAFFEQNIGQIAHTMPKESYALLNDNIENAVSPDTLSNLLLYKIRSTSIDDLSTIHDMSEGLEFRIKDAAVKAKDYTDLVERIKTKRYVRTRIQRVLLNILFDIRKEYVKEVITSNDAAYARVLGFNDNGRRVMNYLRKDVLIPLITNVNKANLNAPLCDTMLQKDMTSTDIYTLLRGDCTGALDRTKQPIYLRSQQ